VDGNAAAAKAEASASSAAPAPAPPDGNTGRFVGWAVRLGLLAFAAALAVVFALDWSRWAGERADQSTDGASLQLRRERPVLPAERLRYLRRRGRIGLRRVRRRLLDPQRQPNQAAGPDDHSVQASTRSQMEVSR
jgi:hypothetical protein